MSKLLDKIFTRECPDVPIEQLKCSASKLDAYEWSNTMSMFTKEFWNTLTLTQRKLMVLATNDINRGYIIRMHNGMEDLITKGAYRYKNVEE